MVDYNLVLIGESDFTAFFAESFKNELKILLIESSIFNNSFSNFLFPHKSFLPGEIEISNAYGQVCSDDFRMDLIANPDLLNLFFDKDLKCSKNFLNDYLIKSAKYLNLLNEIIVENYPEGLWGLFKKRPVYFLENYFVLTRFFRKISYPTEEFVKFTKLLISFFSPGEVNGAYYNFYLLFSLLNKPVYKIKENLSTMKSIKSLRDDELKEISYEDKKWKLIFAKQTITSEFIVSSLTPHLFILNSIKTPFRRDYNEIFYEFFIDDVELPEPMLDEIVYLDRNGREYFARKENQRIFIYTNYLIQEKPTIELIKPFVEQFIPYIKLNKNVTIKPTNVPFYRKTMRRKLRDKRNFYFIRQYDFPFYGVDGEILYRNKLKEIIWKKLLL